MSIVVGIVSSSLPDLDEDIYLLHLVAHHLNWLVRMSILSKRMCVFKWT